ncbi:hypothetical protein [Umezawaea beigongshangensis]|uniref:hypothetical protein n=1 Tax=Umezawaea beigongshangensis TaxID=2780383 RepID=UPI0018F11DBC|nr:hypothetical protein [Umezawaea beigongshangensis]
MEDRIYPDGLTRRLLESLQGHVSQEIAASAAPTSALLDGTARQRRDRRILARALKGVVSQYGVTLAQTKQEAEEMTHPVTAATIPAPVFGKAKRVGRKARREAARAAAGSGMGRVA